MASAETPAADHQDQADDAADALSSAPGRALAARALAGAGCTQLRTAELLKLSWVAILGAPRDQVTMETTGSTALSPGNSPPTEISTHGEFNSPRGCRGTFGSVGTAQATRIEADFTGTDGQLATFTGRVVLTKG